MLTSPDQLLNAFDSLAPADQHQVAVEILRRTAGSKDLSDEDFDALAIDVFQTYDAEESSIGHS